jgi:hypothetical protein
MVDPGVQRASHCRLARIDWLCIVRSLTISERVLREGHYRYWLVHDYFVYWLSLIVVIVVSHRRRS